MENNKKPEWFELADNDQPVSRPVKNVPKRNLAFILAGVLVLPMGAGFALLSHEDHSAVAAETLNLTQDSPIAARTSSTQPQNAITMPATSREDDEDDDDDYRSLVFTNSSSSSAPVATPAATQSSQPTPAVAATKVPAVSVPTSKVTAVITPPGSSSTTKDLILPPTKKAGDYAFAIQTELAAAIDQQQLRVFFQPKLFG